jgi:hypothetical protein
MLARHLGLSISDHTNGVLSKKAQRLDSVAQHGGLFQAQAPSPCSAPARIFLTFS